MIWAPADTNTNYTEQKTILAGYSLPKIAVCGARQVLPRTKPKFLVLFGTRVIAETLSQINQKRIQSDVKEYFSHPSRVTKVPAFSVLRRPTRAEITYSFDVMLPVE